MRWWRKISVNRTWQKAQMRKGQTNEGTKARRDQSVKGYIHLYEWNPPSGDGAAYLQKRSSEIPVPEPSFGRSLERILRIVTVNKL